MKRFFWVLAWVFAILYFAAFAFAVIGLYGLFGVEKDSLAVIFLLPLGLPWNLAGDLLPLALQPWFSLVAPMITLWILYRLAR